MKRLIILLVVLAIVFSACSYTLNGLNDFNIYDCNVELTLYLLPSETFLSDYPYSSGDYHFDEQFFGVTKTMIYLQYDSDTYANAKEHCLSSFVLIEENRHEFDGYCFVENNTYRNSKEMESRYPTWFNMFGFNDETQTLFFIGYYNEPISDEDHTLATTDFKGFLTKHFGEYYDFSQ